MLSFLPQFVDDSRQDGYWVEAFPFSTKSKDTPDLIAYGLGTKHHASKIILYRNPHSYLNSSTVAPSGWKQIQIAELMFPVACCYADISGNGYNDVIITDLYGSSMNDIDPNGGRISWLENTGDPEQANWRLRYIGRSPGMHRIKTGHFTTKDAIQIVAAPIIIKSKDLTSPAPVIIYTSPQGPANAPTSPWNPFSEPRCELGGWDYEIPFEHTFRLVHEVTVVHSVDGGLDKILLAGREGVSLIWYDIGIQQWQHENIGSGLPQTIGNPYWGAGTVDLAKVFDDSAGYIASAEAFHGNQVSVYVKEKGFPVNQLDGVKWTRYVLDNYGSLNAEHTGSIHHVICADIDGDGVDETLVAMMGSNPPSWEKSGVWCYKPVDLQNGKFAKFKLCDSSAGRIAAANFRSPQILDYATISYSVPGYFESPNPSVILYSNSLIVAETLNDEVLFRVPRLSSARFVDEVEFLDVASYKLTLVVIPPHKSYYVARKDGIKVISGRVYWEDDYGSVREGTQATTPFEATSMVVNAKDSLVHTNAEGAIAVVMKKSLTSGQPPYSDMRQLIAHNIFPDRFPPGVRRMNFPWVKVEDRPWANGQFKGVEFYNLVGFPVRYADDSDETLCHIQLWTAGVNVSAGFHNHVGQNFCEIHACLVNGTGLGGMHWAMVGDDDFIPEKPDAQNIVVPDMSEHGPLWHTTKDGLPKFRDNGTVDYPWHAWIAGPGDPSKQSFDVWTAFEFPPFVSRVLHTSTRVPKPGLYRLFNPMFGLALSVKDGDPTDGTPIIATRPNDRKDQLWELAITPGTDFFTLQNIGSGSLGTVSWPPVLDQKLVGSRSQAMLGITTQHAFVPIRSDRYQIRLINTDLVWSLSRNTQVVLMKGDPDEGRANWVLQRM